jgi:hypothetical protein
MKRTPITRRSLLKAGAAAMAAPIFARNLFSAPASGVLRHASFGASGMAWADIQAICSENYVQLVAVAEVDTGRLREVKARFPDVRIYQDWRQMLAKEASNIDSVNVSTPDHMHAAQAVSAMLLGKHVYGQKPLAHDLHEVRRMTLLAREKKLVTQMGIQIHSQRSYRQAVALIQEGAIGKIREVHTWSDKKWGDSNPRPDRSDQVPENLDWDQWLGVCTDRSYIGGSYYHPNNWRRRLDFGTGTFGDMGCHIFDPVFKALALTAPTTVRSEGAPPNAYNWPVDCVIRYVFPGTQYTEGQSVNITWYDGGRRPPEDVQALLGDIKLPDQGSVFIGADGCMLLPHIAGPRLLPADKFREYKMPDLKSIHHWTEFAQACIGQGTTSTGFDYSGPLTEAVLLGSVAVRFPKTTLSWDAAAMRFTNEAEANRHVRRPYRKGWEVEGL